MGPRSATGAGDGEEGRDGYRERTDVVTLIGGASFLLLAVPLMALIGAVTPEDMKALDSLFERVGPVSRLFRFILWYYGIFCGDRS